MRNVVIVAARIQGGVARVVRTQRWRARAGGVLVSGGLLWATLAAAAEPDLPPGVIALDETVISGNQELPKVLYIVPWQQPEGLPQIDLEPELGEAELFRRLYRPAYQRELEYHQAYRSSEE